MFINIQGELRKLTLAINRFSNLPPSHLAAGNILMLYVMLLDMRKAFAKGNL